MHDQPPSNSDGHVLYQRLRDGEINASADIANAYYDSLCSWIEGIKRGLDAHYYQMAVDDALIDLFQRPDTYNPMKGTLERFLKVASKNRLRNILRSERRHGDRRAPIEAVEHDELIVNVRQGNAEEDPAEIFERREQEEALLVQWSSQRSATALPDSVTDSLTSVERKVLELHLRHERKTAVFAQVMGITNLPPEEQKAHVKRLRDKLDKRLRRARENT